MRRKRALLLSGLVFPTWHLPLAFLTPVLPIGTRSGDGCLRLRMSSFDSIVMRARESTPNWFPVAAAQDFEPGAPPVLDTPIYDQLAQEQPDAAADATELPDIPEGAEQVTSTTLVPPGR